MLSQRQQSRTNKTKLIAITLAFKLESIPVSFEFSISHLIDLLTTIINLGLVDVFDSLKELLKISQYNCMQ